LPAVGPLLKAAAKLWPARVIPQPRAFVRTVLCSMRLLWFGPISSLTSIPPPRPFSTTLWLMKE